MTAASGTAGDYGVLEEILWEERVPLLYKERSDSVIDEKQPFVGVRAGPGPDNVLYNFPELLYIVWCLIVN